VRPLESSATSGVECDFWSRVRPLESSATSGVNFKIELYVLTDSRIERYMYRNHVLDMELPWRGACLHTRALLLRAGFRVLWENNSNIGNDAHEMTQLTSC
jgi:hypothetical protein